MKTRPLIFLISTFLAYFSCFSENRTVLTIERNLPRPGDELSVVRYSVTDFLKSGENIIWNFSNASVVSGIEQFKVLFRGDNNYGLSLDKVRNDFRLEGDTLFWCGFERRMSEMRDSLPAVKVVFPVAYGDSCSSTFYFQGVQAISNHISSKGQSCSKADGYGILIMPDCDTVADVLRMRSDYYISGGLDKDMGSLNDSVPMLLYQCYEWYAQGYRYPLIWVNRLSGYTESGWEEISTDAYSCPRYTQEFLVKNDKENETLREQIELANAQKTHNFQEQNILHDIVVKSIGTEINICFESTTDTGYLELLMSSINGILQMALPRHKLNKGTNEVRADISNLAPGEYALMLLYGENKIQLKFTVH